MEEYGRHLSKPFMQELRMLGEILNAFRLNSHIQEKPNARIKNIKQNTIVSEP